MAQQDQPTSAKTILIVEDDENIRDLLTRVITIETDYEVLFMGSDSEVIERLAEVRSIKPVLFILDYQLPTMTSLELYDILHKQRELQSIPAIIITAFQLNEHIESRLQERDITKLEKPFDLEDFLSYIEQTLQSNTSSVTDIRSIIRNN